MQSFGREKLFQGGETCLASGKSVTNPPVVGGTWELMTHVISCKPFQAAGGEGFIPA